MESDRPHTDLEPVSSPIDRFASDMRPEVIPTPNPLDPPHIEPTKYDFFDFEDLRS
ncbi:MAG: hypothetical protein U9N36_10895 [Euryarchaeota archaeon]|nr:hypothetical protein [Euryarchaeota archaeon]